MCEFSYSHRSSILTRARTMSRDVPIRQEFKTVKRSYHFLLQEPQSRPCSGRLTTDSCVFTKVVLFSELHSHASGGSSVSIRRTLDRSFRRYVGFT